MFLRAKFVLLLLPILSAALAGQTAPGEGDAGSGDRTTTAAVPSADAQEASAKSPAGLTVQFDDRKLTISARQARLSDLLAAIGEKTGVTFDLPDSLAERLITAETGPAALRDSLTALLKKLEVGYGISGDPAEPDIVERVVLTAVTETGAHDGENSSAAETKPREDSSDDGMTPYEVEEMLAQKAISQNLAIEKNLAEAEAERQAQIGKEDFGGKPPEPDKTAPSRKRARKNSVPPPEK